ADDQSIDGGPPPAAVLLRPGHPDPAVGGHLLGELLGIAVDPRVVEPPEPGDGVGGDTASFLAEFELFGRPREIHQPDDARAPAPGTTLVDPTSFIGRGGRRS